jgi:hypothetical protein
LTSIDAESEKSKENTQSQHLPEPIENKDGATLRDRTGDLLITNQPLYQLS